MEATPFSAGQDEPTRHILDSKNCTDEVLVFKPSFFQLLEVFGLAGKLLIACATVAMVTLVILFADTLQHVLRHAHSKHKFHAGTVLTVYPVLGMCNYLGILFQKANIIVDAASLLWFSLCLWQFFQLTLTYLGGESSMAKKMAGTVLRWRNTPCCCWPCCWPCFPKEPVNKCQIRFIKILILQYPFLQAIITIIALTLWLEGWFNARNFSPNDAYVYLFVFSTVSFLFALWAFIVTFKSSRSKLDAFFYKTKLISFQLCIICLRLQGLIISAILLPSGAIPCLPPISPKVYANILHSSLMMGQLVVLSVVARHGYKKKVPLVIPDVETHEMNPEETPFNNYVYNGEINGKTDSFL